MKKLTLSLICFFHLFSICSISGQGLELVRNNNVKTIPNEDLVEIRFAPDFLNMDCENCSFQSVVGKVSAIAGDSLSIGILERIEYDRMNESSWENKTMYKSIAQEMMVAKKDIFNLVQHKSQKIRKRKKNLFGLGSLLLLSGITSTGANFLFSEKVNKKKALIYGGAQFGIGVLLMNLNKEKKYDLRINNPKAWALR